jgi:hypothetical protein
MDFMARIIIHLLEEQEDNSNKLRTRDLAIEAERMKDDLENLSIQESRAYTPEIVRGEVLSLNLVKYPQ